VHGAVVGVAYQGRLENVEQHQAPASLQCFLQRLVVAEAQVAFQPDNADGFFSIQGQDNTAPPKDVSTKKPLRKCAAAFKKKRQESLFHYLYFGHNLAVANGDIHQVKS
jgi:hypothetical protein